MTWLEKLLGAAADEDAVEDLLTWEEENDQLLPNGLTPDDIARFESMGYIANLETGTLIPEADANNYGVSTL